MNSGEIAKIFSLLEEGAIRSLDRDENNIRIRVYLPKLARAQDPDTENEYFFCTLKGCTEFFLQPFRNSDMIIKSFDEILRLQLSILSAQPATGDKVKVFCSHKGAESGATLYIKADAFLVYNESFDQLGIGELTELRKEAG